MGVAVPLGVPAQAKLNVGTPGDRYEEEADQVADRVASGRAAGDVSRIPPGGLKAQREAEEGEEQEGQTPSVQQVSEKDSEKEPEPASQTAAKDGEQEARTSAVNGDEQVVQTGTETDNEAPSAQTRDDESSEESAAQPRNEAGEENIAAQAKSSASGEGENRIQPATEDAKETAQREPKTDEETAQSEDGEEESVQRDEENDEDEASEGGDEDAEAPECGEAESGPSEAEGDEEEESAEPEEEPEGGVSGEAESEPGCGEEGGGEEAEAAGGDGESCGATPAAGAEGEGGTEGPEAGGEAGPEAAGEGAPASGGSVPSCATEVEAGSEEPEAEGEGGQQTEGEEQGGEECRAQTKQDENAPQEAEQTQGQDTSPAQQQADEDERTAQTKEDEEPAARSESDEGAEQKAQDAPENEDGADEIQAQRQEQETDDEAERTASEDETAVQRQEDEDEEAQTRRVGGGRRLQTAVASRHMQARGAGEQLLPSLRDRIEATLGVDLEGVRVHADSNAQAASKALRAKAFTHRNHIFLGRGQSQHDLSLMAHESTHVLQQDGIVRRKPKSEPERRPDPEESGAPRQASGPDSAAAAPTPTPATVPYPSIVSIGPSRTAGGGVGARDEIARPSEVTGSTGEEAGTAPSSVPTRPGQPVPTAEAPSTPSAAAVSEVTTENPTRASSAEPAPDGAAPAPSAPEPEYEQAATPSTESAQASAAPPNEEPEAEASPTVGEAAPTEEVTQEAPGAPAAEGGAQQAIAAAPTPEPQADARFQGVMTRLGESATREKSHAPAQHKITAARAAVEQPENERPSRAEQQQMGVMESQPDAPPQPEDFLTILRKKIQEIAPRNMQETLELKKSGKVAQMKSTLTAKVGQQKKAATGPLRQAAKASPDIATIPETKPTPVPAEPQDPAAAGLQAREVLPQPKPDAEISAEDNKKKADRLMAENDIDEAQLKRANEPQFTQALEAKKELEGHADRVPERYREQETALITGQTGGIAAQEGQARVSMRVARNQAKGAVRSKQAEATKREEAQRRKIAEDIRAVSRQTKQGVEGSLNGLDSTVGSLFDEGERTARDRFESDVEGRMEAYKDKRYRGAIGKGKWVYDKLAGLPDEVNAFYTEGRDQYIADMGVVLEGIAAKVEAELAAAKKQIAEGKRKIADYVDKLEPRLQGYGKDTRDAIAGDFDALEGAVENKKQTLADDLAQRYRESRRRLDERIEELKAENQGLLDKFIGFIQQVIEVLRKLKDMIVLLVKVGGEIVRGIVKDPSGFLDNLLGAINRGFKQFSARIRAIVKRIQRPVERAIDAVLRAIVRGLKWVGRKVGTVARKGGAAVKRFLFPKRAFQAEREPHRLFFRGSGPQAKKKALSEQLGSDARKSWKEREFAIERFELHRKQSLPKGGETLGLDTKWQTSAGKKLKVPPPRRTPGGGRINAALAPFGYSPKREGMDGDHVVEIQLGGEDLIPNLWPLDKSENRGAGSTLKSARFDKPAGGTITMAELKQRAKGNQDIWLVIASMK